MITYDDTTLKYDGISRYTCDLTVSGWQRCADNSGTDTGGTYGVGKSLKSVGVGSGVGAGNDLVGFAGKLSGFRNTDGSYNDLGWHLYLWSSTPSGSSYARRRGLYSTYSTVYRNASNRALGFSVRCLRDTDDTSDFTDSRDGNVYQCVKIGTQVWMTKNLAYLPSVNTGIDGSTADPKYYVYGYNGTDVATAKATTNYINEGVLYNYPAAIISAPDGFHVPSDEEMNVLEVFVFNMIYKQASYDGQTGYYQTHYDYGYAGDSTNKQLETTSSDNLISSDVTKKSLFRTLTDNVNISDTANKSLQITTTDNLSISETFKKSLSRTVTELLKVSDSAGKFMSDIITDTISISDITLKSLQRTVTDRLSASEVLKRCKNGLEIIWERLNKPITSWNNSNTKPSTSWNNEEKPNKCL